MSKYWRNAVLLSWASFIIVEAIVGYDKYYSEYPICPLNNGYSNGYWYMCFACLGGFVMSWFVLLFKLFQFKDKKSRIPQFIGLNILSIGALTTLLTVMFDWGGVCIDVLGVASPAAIWAEWITTGPLLVFLAVTINGKLHLNYIDWILITSLPVCVIAGAFIIISPSVAIGQFWLIVSIITFCPLLYLPFYKVYKDTYFYHNYSGLNMEEESLMESISNKKQFYLSLWLIIILPFYTVNYLFAMANFIGVSVTMAIYQILSVFTKGLFIGIILDIHIFLVADYERNQLKQGNNARRGFLKYIFHEVRTPLNSVAIGIEVLELSDNLDATDREHLAVMKTATNYMSDTLNSVLNMQKIEEGKFELEYTPFVFLELLKLVRIKFEAAANKKQIRIIQNVSQNAPIKVIGDFNRLQVVIGNLISNAIKFAPINSTIEISADFDGDIELSSDNNTLLMNMTISVRDEGPGISLANQSKLFNNYVQIRPGFLQEGQGSGLGLSFCKKIIDLHNGGKVWIDSNEGYGSTFAFCIPIRAITNPSQDTTPPNEIKLGVSMSMSSIISESKEMMGDDYVDNSLLVLVVDDAESNRKLLSVLLTKIGLRTDMVSDGKIALELIMENRLNYNLILMDNLMPIMNGVEAAKLMRQAGYPFIIAGITGHSMDEDIEEYLNNGADIVYSKPIKLQSLKKLIAYIHANGALSRPGMKLVEGATGVEWMAKSMADLNR